MSKPIKIEIFAKLTEMRGDDDQVTFVVTGHRKNARGRYENYEFELKACRFAVTQLLREFNQLHIRDRARIAECRARMRTELEVFKAAE